METHFEKPHSGIFPMLLSCVCFSLMSAIVQYVQRDEPAASALIPSFFRLVVNFLLIILWAQHYDSFRNLLGNATPSLWLRGIFGSMALMAGFASYPYIGIGESSFLQSGSGVVVALLSPLVLHQAATRRSWLAIVGAIVGLYFLYSPSLAGHSPTGRMLALGSGFMSGLAYLMIARSGRSNSPQTVVFYFCLVGILIHIGILASTEIIWPQKTSTYAWLIVAGIAGSVGQHFLTRSYQVGRAALNAAASYAGPVLNLLVSIVLFENHPTVAAWFGVAIVLFSGIVLPWVRRI